MSVVPKPQISIYNYSQFINHIKDGGYGRIVSLQADLAKTMKRLKPENLLDVNDIAKLPEAIQTLSVFGKNNLNIWSVIYAAEKVEDSTKEVYGRMTVATLIIMIAATVFSAVLRIVPPNSFLRKKELLGAVILLGLTILDRGLNLSTSIRSKDSFEEAFKTEKTIFLTGLEEVKTAVSNFSPSGDKAINDYFEQLKKYFS